MTDNDIFQTVIQSTCIGHVGITTSDGYPRVVPINFAAIGDRIYFHGANHGEKYDAFAAGQKVTVSIELPYAMIPSYWRDPEQACRANQFFKSVLIRGRGAIVEVPEEKAAALQALMEKHQPEGGFRRITASDGFYVKHLAGVTIFRIDPETITVRSETGERLQDDVKLTLIKKLEERGSEVDLKTAAEIRQSIENREKVE